jgi:GR25 family glycosyltransferase involved in LPS biosynthesis
MDADVYGVDWLSIDLPFKCAIYYQVPPKTPLRPDYFNVLIDVSDPNRQRIERSHLCVNITRFDLILSSDETILSNPNVKFTLYGRSENKPIPSRKKFGVSLLTENELAWHKKDKAKVDFIERIESLIMPSGKGFFNSPLENPVHTDFEYMYSICIENRLERNFFSEKLIDCFLQYTIPIYLGADNISSIFGDLILTTHSVDTLDKLSQFVSVAHYRQNLPKLHHARKLANYYANFSNRIREAIIGHYQINQNSCRRFNQQNDELSLFKSGERLQTQKSKAIYYINLAHRQDRRSQIETSLGRIFAKFERVNAVNGKLLNGIPSKIASGVGCALSHLNALQRGLESGADLTFVFEDDFDWELRDPEVITKISELETQEFNIVALSYHIPAISIPQLNRSRVVYARNVQTTAAYVVTRSFIPELMRNIEFGITKLIESLNLDRYMIDQHWKKLQGEEGGFKIAVPRLGCQKAGTSDITGSAEDYGGSCFVAVISCKKFLHRVSVENYSVCPFPFRIFVGGSTFQTVDNGTIVELPVSDTYESLPEKVIAVFGWIRTNYPNMSFIFKTDDDVRHDFGSLFELFKGVSRTRVLYAGHVVTNQVKESSYHFGKTSPGFKNELVRLSNIDYCAGGGYFLHSTAVDLLLDPSEKFENLFEDYSVGFKLKKHGITPKHLSLYGVTSFW